MELIFDIPPAHGRSFSAGSARSFLNSVVRQKLKGLLKPYEDLSKLMCMWRIQSIHRHSCISANVNTGREKSRNLLYMRFARCVPIIGVNRGYLISTAGFQSGAERAARNSNIALVSWEAFQQQFFDRWLKAMGTRLAERKQIGSIIANI